MVRVIIIQDLGDLASDPWSATDSLNKFLRLSAPQIPHLLQSGGNNPSFFHSGIMKRNRRDLVGDSGTRI